MRLLRTAVVLAAAAMVLIGVLWWLAGSSGQPHAARLAELARIEPEQAPDTALRGDGTARPDDYARGMAAYREGDFQGAVRALRPVVDTDPEDALAALYLGVALLQTGAPASALAPLQAAAAHGTGLVQERALWFAAAAFLLREDADGARGALERLRELDGDYAPNAVELLRALEGR